MALFTSKKSKEKEEEEAPVVIPNVRRTFMVKTNNVPRELMKIAKSRDIKVDKLDFNIIDIKTYKRQGQESEWEYVLADAFYEFDDEIFLNPDFQIKQVYEVEIFIKIKSEEEKNPYKDLKLSLAANNLKTKIYATIMPGSKLTYHPKLENDLITIINKRKIRAGILVHIFDEMMEANVHKLVSRVEVQDEITFKEKESFLVAEGYDPIPMSNDRVVLHYKKKKKKAINANEKVDYAERDFIDNVKKDQLIIEKVKGKEGQPGRDCRGMFIKTPVLKDNRVVDFAIDDTIKQVEDEDSIKYYADINGYVVFENNTYKIKNDVEVNNITFKSTGKITSGVDSDVSINVKESDAIKDAIGNGMVVEVSEINVRGNVGSNAQVYAMKANIEGQTHQSAVVRADKVNINVHKGTAYGKNVHIERLEHGVVECDVAEVVQAIGGTIKAKEVFIDVCESHVKVTASKIIEIKKLHGSENIFTIDPLIKRASKRELAKNQKEVEELEKDIKTLKKDIETYAKLLKDGASSFKDIKRRLASYKKNGVKMPESFVKKYKQYQQLQEKYEKAKKEYEIKVDKHTMLTTQTASFQDNIMDARIINRGRWIGYNEIKFRLVDPPMDIVYKPKEGSTEKVFALVEVDEGEYKIEAVEE